MLWTTKAVGLLTTSRVPPYGMARTLAWTKVSTLAAVASLLMSMDPTSWNPCAAGAWLDMRSWFGRSLNKVSIDLLRRSSG